MSRSWRNRSSVRLAAATVGVLCINFVQAQSGSLAGTALADTWTNRQTAALSGIDKVAVVVSTSGDGARRLGLPAPAKNAIEEQLRKGGVPVDSLRFVKNVPESAILEIDTRLQLIPTPEGKLLGISYAIEGNLLDPVSSARRNMPRDTVGIIWRTGQYGFVTGKQLVELNHKIDMVVNQFVIDWQKAAIASHANGEKQTSEIASSSPTAVNAATPNTMAVPAAATTKPVSKWRKAQLDKEAAKAAKAAKTASPSVVAKVSQPPALAPSTPVQDPSAPSNLAGSLFEQPAQPAPAQAAVPSTPSPSESQQPGLAAQPAKLAWKKPSPVKGKPAPKAVAKQPAALNPQPSAQAIPQEEESSESFADTAAVFGNPVPGQKKPVQYQPPAAPQPSAAITLGRKEPTRVDTKAALMLQKQNAIIRQNQAIIAKQQELLVHNHQYFMAEEAKEMKKKGIKPRRPPRRVNATFPTTPGQQQASAPAEGGDSAINLFQ
ncbi:MAG: hypothetical protein K2Z81_02030 [Cyanobacteria bacterium]|nr:hypothetical protein [Cyanobacteriota bacterium]